jgi:hypothetical protein
MITLLQRYFARRRLRPVVGALPRRLAKAFGVGTQYTFRQTKRVTADLGLRKGVELYALVAACRLEELEKAGVPISAQEYERLRAELADLFHLRGADFTVRHLLATPFSSHHPAQENAHAGGPPSGYEQ